MARRVREYRDGDDKRVQQAVECLRCALELLVAARCPKTVARVRLALSSAKGAVRNVGYRRIDHERQLERRSA